jgi:hypothetical protein
MFSIPMPGNPAVSTLADGTNTPQSDWFEIEPRLAYCTDGALKTDWAEIETAINNQTVYDVDSPVLYTILRPAQLHGDSLPLLTQAVSDLT